jgi:hypothetical protein
MIERLRHRRTGEPAAMPLQHSTGAVPATIPPGALPPADPADSEPTLFGLPAEVETDGGAGRGAMAQAGMAVEERPHTAVRMVVRRRADLGAGAALAVAGIAANVSLWLPWVAGEDQTGLTLVRQAVGAADAGWEELLRDGLWQPVVILLGGGLLAVLGLLVITPAHTHRAVGVVALFVALATTAAVLSLLFGADWDAARFGPGLWAGAAVAASGLLGAFKAMLTLPRVTTVEEHLGG